MKPMAVKNENSRENVVIGVVEADKAVREALQSLLTAHGYEALGQASAEEALADLSRFDLLVVGDELPGISGIELLESMQLQSVRLPSIMVMASGNVPMTVRAIRAGASDCLEKPFFQSTLLQRIKQALSNYPLRDVSK
jgi:two-component system, response regulator FlrC